MSVLFNNLSLAVNMYGGEDTRIRSYSGRGMYGKSCVGIVCNSVGTIARLIAYATVEACTSDEGEDFADAVSGMHTDSMGSSIIFYWPSQEWSEEFA
jgi:hypothetical protein